MPLVRISLPDDIESRLSREDERYLADLETAARSLAHDPVSCREAQDIAEEFLPLENEAWAARPAR